MLDLCPKGVDLGIKPSAPSCPPILPPYPGLQTEQTESQGHPTTTATSRRATLVSVKPKLRFKLPK